jgi:hypothetical protein
MTVDNSQSKVRDIRGLAIEPGCEVVACELTPTGRAILLGGVVKEIRTTGESDSEMIFIRGLGGYYKPNQVAVVESAADVTARRLNEPRTDRERFGGYPGTDPYAAKPEQHVVSVGADSGGWRANCSCGAIFSWHQIVKQGRVKAKSLAQQDAAAHLRMIANGDDGEEYTRADGNVKCVVCTDRYADHPIEEFPGSTSDLGDSPLILHRLCDGRLVKL